MLRYEGVWDSESVAPRILNLSTRSKWVASLMTRPLYPRWKNSLDRRLGGPQGRSGRGRGQKNSCLCQESNPGHPARRL